MRERLHIIITGENGRSSSFQLSKKRLNLAIGTIAVLFVATFVFGYMTTGSYLNSRLQARKIDKLEQKLTQQKAENRSLAEQIETISAAHDKALADQQQRIEALTEAHEVALADQRMQFDLENTTLQLENIRLMTTAVNDLNERSELIETVMNTVGVEIANPLDGKPAANSGGPYIPDLNDNYEALISKVDTYLQTVRTIPLGKPVAGSVSSSFGKRSDPLNKQKAIHEGVDLRGSHGEKIRATASGTVVRAGKNGGYGNYVEIDHGNGYRTVYGHLQNYLVEKGEQIEQGQIIGQVGTTGRSTGPHVHYEIKIDNKPVNPKKFMKVAGISHTFGNNQE